MDTTSGTLDEALERLHTTGPEFHGYLSNHGPMAVEALVRHGQDRTVHNWVDRYVGKLEGVPSAQSPVTDANWQQALGDPRRVTDWTTYMTRQVAERPWREVLAEWWPRLLPGIAGAATHPVIRVGHAVRTLLEQGEEEPRSAELAHALGYWAARHTTLPVTVRPTGTASPADALAALPRVADQRVAPLDGLAQLPKTEGWLAAAEAVNAPQTPDAARDELAALVRAATHRYLDYGHGSEVLLVHAATAPNAVLRTLPALPAELWAPSLDAAWAASAALTSVYSADEPLPPLQTGRVTPEEVFERATAHGDEHAIKFTDTALDVASWAPAGDERALAAALRSQELIRCARL
ncbi:questin oxidase family protein [Streptomyces piniterrae]|uniref:Questin oxidase family protein n=1 Tax=Streptomyces piniterrae TaxID=2571125 RepID=A0A4U0NPU7_9ACTN|nr:questin oxidase family protein [Streptomyces piniterrae]TJZ52174.1 questin oxidase family protein [Streptomyces piniterrae]